MNKLEKHCDDKYLYLIKLIAGFKSEISPFKEGMQIGGDYVLQSHHINGKSNYLLRYSILNGICITQPEHNNEAHANEFRPARKTPAYKGNKHEKFKQKVRDLRGEDIYERLDVLKHDNTKLDLNDVKEMLEQEIKKYEGS